MKTNLHIIEESEEFVFGMATPQWFRFVFTTRSQVRLGNLQELEKFLQNLINPQRNQQVIYYKI